MNAVRTGWERCWPLGAVLAASLAFRAPAILHAAETNSDAAVVGLQAMHLLRGEWSWFLWGSGYQTSIDSLVAAAFFAVFGASPGALLASSFGLHLLLTSLAWSTLARRLGGAPAALAVLPLVFTSCPSETYILYPPRQAALTLAVAALCVFDWGAEGGRAAVFGAGAALLGLACFADPYAFVLAPPVAAFAAACAFARGEPRRTGTRAAAIAAGGILGAVPAVLLRTSARATEGQTSLSADVVAHNARLLVDPCLPWAVGARAWSAPDAMRYAPWDGPAVVRALDAAGGVLFLAAIAAGGACVFARRIPWEVRRLAIVGALALPVTIGGFLLSPMVMDLFSARYLAAIPLLAPFALAPLAHALGVRRFAALIAPCVLATGVAGWTGYGPFLHAPPGDGAEEARLEAALAERGVRLATADYWASYRLTLLTREALVVVPVNPAEDRYAPYRAAFEAAPRVAYVFDPARSREPAAWMSERVAAGDAPLEGELETVQVGRFTVWLGRPRPPRPARR